MNQIIAFFRALPRRAALVLIAGYVIGFGAALIGIGVSDAFGWHSLASCGFALFFGSATTMVIFGVIGLLWQIAEEVYWRIKRVLRPFIIVFF